MQKNKKKISLSFLFFILIQQNNFVFAGEINNYIEPENKSDFQFNQSKKGVSTNQIIVTANNYASKIGEQILNNGGNVADATVAIQLTLGLVEPQSSGIGGGSFITYYDDKKKRCFFMMEEKKLQKI